LDPPILVDLQLSWNAGEAAHAGGGLLGGVVLRAGATNLFDEDPPFTEVQGAYGFDPSQFEIRGRFLYLKVTKAF
jgi:outer membrane receptor protein involved in Fe transport